MVLCHWLPGGSYRPSGMIGEALEKSVRNRLTKINYEHLVAPFRERWENEGTWCTEFWGKIVRSAVYSWRTTRDTELEKILRATVKDLLSTQTPDGVISTTESSGQLGRRTPGMGPFDFLPGAWDVWGRKYVLLALIAYYEEVEQDPAVLQACCRLLDNLISQTAGPGSFSLLECGRHYGLAASSILAAVVKMAKLTGKKEYLEYAENITSSGCTTTCHIFDAARRGVPPKDIATSKAYEMTSCFEGLADLCDLETRPGDEKTVLDYFAAVLKREIFVTGTAGLRDEWGEYFDDGKFKQTRLDNLALGETCITVAYLMLAGRVYQMTADPRLYDEMETSFYNAVIGAMSPDGTQWCHQNPTPLAGPSCKNPAQDQMGHCFGKPFDGHDCCLAQGPQGLALAPCCAVFTNADDELILNGYEPAEVRFKEWAFTISGDYPRSRQAVIRFTVPHPFTGTLKLRNPAWNAKGSFTLNGKRAAAEAGTYLTLRREWHDGDTIEITFDFALRRIEPPESDGFFAVQSGPLLLVQDSRAGVVDGRIDLAQPQTETHLPYANKAVKVGKTTLIDYASAGGEFRPDNTLCVFFRE